MSQFVAGNEELLPGLVAMANLVAAETSKGSSAPRDKDLALAYYRKGMKLDPEPKIRARLQGSDRPAGGLKATCADRHLHA